MKKSLFVVIALFVLSYFALAAPKDQSWNAWVSETACGAKGANAQHAGCAKKCIANGEKPVLVTDKDQKVLTVENPDALKDHAGEHGQPRHPPAGVFVPPPVACGDSYRSTKLRSILFRQV